MTFFPAGTYKARLILDVVNGEYQLSDNVHIINIHRDGQVTEPRYYNLETQADVTFTPDRQWNPALLPSYHLEAVD